jgi:hypothetical protein
MNIDNKKNKQKNRYIFLKVFLLIIFLIASIYVYNPLVKNHLFNFIETHILYREIPPVYNDSTFRDTEPNQVCSYMNEMGLNTNSYSRSDYFEFSCSSVSLVDNKTNYSIQYLTTGKVFNVSTLILNIKFLNYDNKDFAISQFKNYLNLLINKVSGEDMSDIINEKLKTHQNFQIYLKNDIYLRLVFTEEDLTIYIN